MQLEPFASKILQDGKKLYSRTVGITASLSAGSNVIEYTIPYPWVKMVGIEAINCEALDIVDCKIIDTNTGTYSGVPNYVLNQFGYAVNLPKDFYSRTTNFDADLYLNMVIRLEYSSVSSKTIGINFLIHEVK